MAGKAMRKRLLAMIEADAGPDRTGPEFVADYLGSGGFISELAEKYDCSRSYLSRMFHDLPEYAAVLPGARQEQAEAIAEELVQIADDTQGTDSAVEVMSAKLRVDVRKWLASMNNPERFADKRGQVNLQVNIGSLHLDAMRRRSIETAPPMRDITPQVRDNG